MAAPPPPPPDTIIVVPWLVLNTIGQLLLLFLLLTLAFGEGIPHRRNLFLLSLVFGNLLATIPPNLMLYIGRVLTAVPHDLCVAQSVMMDTVPTIIFLVLFFLALDNLAELCHLCFRTKHFTRQITIYSILVVLPYFLIGAFTVWNYMETVTTDDNFSIRQTTLDWAWCRTDNPGSKQKVRNAMKILVLTLNFLVILIEFGVLGLIYIFPLKEERDSKIWRTTSAFSIRVLALFTIQLVALILVAIPSQEHSPIQMTYEMLEAMQGIAVFLVFASQKAFFYTWSQWSVDLWNRIRRKPKEDPYEPQPFGLPAHSFPDYERERYPWETSKWDEESVSYPEGTQAKGFRRWLKVPSFKFSRLPSWRLHRKIPFSDRV